MTRSLARTAITAILFATAATLSAQTVRVAPTIPNALYPAGATPAWTVSVSNLLEGQTLPLRYRWKHNGLKPIGEDSATALSNTTLNVSAPTPLDAGTLLLEVEWTNRDGTNTITRGGAIAAPESFQPARPVPADFDNFWQACRAELADVPMHPRIEEAPGGRDNVSYAKIELAGIGGRTVHAQLARPAKATGKLPGLVIVQWAGVYALKPEWVTGHAAAGWLAINVMAHDLPIDKPAEFYKEQAGGPLKSYTQIGRESRDTCYFRGMILGDLRAIDYLTSRDDWDGRTLVVMGGSQGGYQALAVAGIDPRVTAALACVPGGCDMDGQRVGRVTGWPNFLTSSMTPENAPAILATSDYYDAVHFASRINVPILVAAGAVDTTCPPGGILVMANQLQGPHEVMILGRSGHQDTEGSQAPYWKRSGAWLDALCHGRPVPPPAP